MVVKYLGENIGQDRCTKKGIYAYLVSTADSRVQRSAVVEPRLPILPIHKQINKAQINNQNHVKFTTRDAMSY